RMHEQAACGSQDLDRLVGRERLLRLHRHPEPQAAEHGHAYGRDEHGEVTAIEHAARLVRGVELVGAAAVGEEIAQLGDAVESQAAGESRATLPARVE